VQKRRCRSCWTISKLLLGSGSGVAGTSGVVVEDVLHGSSLLVAELEAGLSARIEGRTNFRAVGITANGQVDGVDVLLLTSGSSTISQGLLVGVGHTTLDVRIVLMGLLLDVGVGVRRMQLRCRDAR
jgi:hypothetical protein